MAICSSQNIGCRPDILTANRPLSLHYFALPLKPFCRAYWLAFCLRSSLYGGCKRMDSPGLVDQIGHAAQMLRLFQLAQVRILFAERCQPLFQPGIVGVDAGSAFSLVEQDDGFFLNLRQSRHCQPPYCRPRCDSK